MATLTTTPPMQRGNDFECQETEWTTRGKDLSRGYCTLKDKAFEETVDF